MKRSSSSSRRTIHRSGTSERLVFGPPPAQNTPRGLASRSVLVRVGLLVFGFLTLGIVILTFVSDRGLLAVWNRASEYEALQEQIRSMEQENAALSGEIQALRTDPAEIERRAREDLKLARPGEVILVVPSEDAEVDPTEDQE